MPRTLLTDDARNLTFECLHAEEAEFLFEEVFTRRSYCQSGVRVPKRGAPLVVDVGANIGLFSLFALTENPRATVIAIEPAPQLFAILERNLDHHFDTGAAECVRALMLDEPGVQTLYYYADAPGESTRNPIERSMQRKRLATAMREGSRGRIPRLLRGGRRRRASDCCGGAHALASAGRSPPLERIERIDHRPAQDRRGRR